LVILGLVYPTVYDIPNVQLIISYILPILAFLFFGYDYLKNTKGMCLGVLGIIIPTSTYLWGLEDMWNNLFGIIGGRDILELNIGRFRVNVFGEIFRSTDLAFRILLFWRVIHYLKIFDKSGVKLLDKKLFNHKIKDRIYFSILFWVFRIGLASLMFGGIERLEIFYRSDLEITITLLIRLITITFGIVLGIFIISSLYRNLMLSFFISRGHYPSWFFYVLNIPLLNLIAWIIFLIKDKQAVDIEGATILDETSEAQNIKTETAPIESLKEKFTLEGKNNGIKTLIYAACAFSLVFPMFAMAKYDNYEMLVPLVISFLVNLAFLLLYLNNPKGIYFILGINLLAILTYSLFEVKTLIEYVSFYSLGTMIVCYPLFHFNQFTMVNEDIKITDQED
jgi:hypothetical protein